MARTYTGEHIDTPPFLTKQLLLKVTKFYVSNSPDSIRFGVTLRIHDEDAAHSDLCVLRLRSGNGTPLRRISKCVMTIYDATV